MGAAPARYRTLAGRVTSAAALPLVLQHFLSRSRRAAYTSDMV